MNTDALSMVPSPLVSVSIITRLMASFSLVPSASCMYVSIWATNMRPLPSQAMVTGSLIIGSLATNCNL